MQELDSVNHTDVIKCRTWTPCMDVAARGEGDGVAEPKEGGVSLRGNHFPLAFSEFRFV